MLIASLSTKTLISFSAINPYPNHIGEATEYSIRKRLILEIYF